MSAFCRSHSVVLRGKNGGHLTFGIPPIHPQRVVSEVWTTVRGINQLLANRKDRKFNFPEKG